MNKLLLVIDCQYDFINGSLSVDGSEKVMNHLAEYIKTAKDNDIYTAAFATVDWHQSTHSSFKENGGEWNAHCIQYSHGASIYDNVLKELNEMPYFTVFTKGTQENREEYSIFKNAESKEKLIKQIEYMKIDEIDICGLCLDYCVINTIKDALREMPNIKINLLANYSPSIGDANDAINFINNSERTTWVEE
jgi:nicotinamidase/pyrazinamidase